jgi:hypothetical protein
MDLVTDQANRAVCRNPRRPQTFLSGGLFLPHRSQGLPALHGGLGQRRCDQERTGRRDSPVRPVLEQAHRRTTRRTGFRLATHHLQPIFYTARSQATVRQ